MLTNSQNKHDKTEVGPFSCGGNTHASLTLVTFTHNPQVDRDFLLKIARALSYDAKSLLSITIASPLQESIDNEDFAQHLELIDVNLRPQVFWFFGQVFHKIFTLPLSWNRCQQKEAYLKQVGERGIVACFFPSLEEIRNCSQTKE